jgi:hypothetical protein
MESPVLGLCALALGALREQSDLNVSGMVRKPMVENANAQVAVIYYRPAPPREQCDETTSDWTSNRPDKRN